LAARWPEARVREIGDPLNGIGLRLPPEDDPSASDRQNRFPADLLEFTRQFPVVTFVYVKVECFGGACDHWGYAARDGSKLDQVEEADSRGLERLLAHPGVSLQGGASFEPFSRTYPW
jgi:hypothetical protein